MRQSFLLASAIIICWSNAIEILKAGFPRMREFRTASHGQTNPAGEHDFGDGIIPTSGNIFRNNLVKIGSTILGVMVLINNDCWSAEYTQIKKKSDYFATLTAIMSHP